MMTYRKLALCSAAILASACAPSLARHPGAALPQEADPYFQAGAERAARLAADAPRARNVIVFIGDGMGVTTVTAARIYAGQSQGRDGESNALAIDGFPHTALSRTYSHDHQVADSAATATAILAGVKTRSGVIGLTSAAAYGACQDEAGAQARSVFELAEAAGLATGIVSTARITHATPAAAYAHSAHRDWENDAAAAHGGGSACVDIARQLIEWPAGDGVEIALGGGRANFLPDGVADPEHAELKGVRADGRDLTAEWAARPGHAYVWNSAQLAAASNAAHVLGLFAPSHLAYESQRANDPGGEPSLAEMTRAAINRLKTDAEGYVLLVEGGRIDHAHHEGRAREALSETVAFDEAVRAALDMTSREDTLIIVTADHSHVLAMAGYASRNHSILGLSTDEDSGQVAHGADGRPYTTLGYLNGPGAAPASAEGRPDLSTADTAAWNFHQQAAVPLAYETHGGEDVVFYAWGPGDSSFAGTLEQNVAFHLMARALGLAK